MTDRPIRRLTLKNEELNGSLDVRNYLDWLEDELNIQLAPIWPQIQEMVSDAMLHEMCFGPGSSRKMQEENQHTINKLIEEYGEAKND